MKTDAFISYRREGGFLMAQLLRELLKNKGINCYLDLEEEYSGQFDVRLIEAIDSASNFLLVLTKDALNRCVDPEDWVRREIVEAANRGKNIIPVRYPDFEWPKELNSKLPEEIRFLENEQGVILRQEYLHASIEKIVNTFMVDVKKYEKDDSFYRIHTSTEEYFKSGFEMIEKVTGIDISFRAGSEWHHKSGLVDILLRAIEEKICVRVIVNDENTVEQLSVHMRQPLKKYYGYNKSCQDWLEKSESYPDIIHVRVADVPLMHRYYCIKGLENGVSKVSLYTYGNYIPEKDFQYIFDKSDNEYVLFENEFNYLWNKASHNDNLG